MPNGETKHVIVVLPGILGSVLAKDGDDVWGLSPRALLRGLLTLGGSVRGLAVIDDDPQADDLGDGVTATRLMPDVHFAPGLWKIDGYSRLIRSVRQAFRLEPGTNYFEFAYDWRRDLRATARLLRRKTAGWLRDWRVHSGYTDAKIIFLAHSMGGLLARRFIECEEDGLEDTHTLFTIGTPYAGSLNALNFLANGYKKGLGPIRLIDLSILLRSLTSVYQLLPTYPCYDPGDGRLLRVGEAGGIPNLDANRAADALSFHREITERAASHIGAYAIRPIVGINQPTFQGARFDGRDGLTVEYSLAGQDLAGDGTVPRPSATPVEWDEEEEHPIFFSSELHSSLQNSDAVLTQIRGVLTGSYERSRYRAPVDVELSMNLPDWVDPRIGAELRIEARPIFDKTASTTVRIGVENVDASTAAVPSIQKLLPPATTVANELPQLPEGVYRVRVEAVDSEAMPLTDIFAVISER